MFSSLKPFIPNQKRTKKHLSAYAEFETQFEVRSLQSLLGKSKDDIFGLVVKIAVTYVKVWYECNIQNFLVHTCISFNLHLWGWLQNLRCLNILTAKVINHARVIENKTKGDGNFNEISRFLERRELDINNLNIFFSLFLSFSYFFSLSEKLCFKCVLRL